jgi:galactose-1-phosphate uridylyltransferase
MSGFGRTNPPWEGSQEKTIPVCPLCNEEMKRTGTKNRGEERPVRVFQCMNIYCRNPRRYLRSGEEL